MRGPLAAGLSVFFASCAVMAAPPAGQRPVKASEVEKWTSIYIQGAKVGYSRAVSRASATGRRVETTTLIKAEMLGSQLEMSVETSTVYSLQGRPVRMEFVTTSSGRTLKVTAEFTPSAIKAKAESGGQTSAKTIAIKPSMVIVDDPASYVSEKGGPVENLYVFDANSLSLVKVGATAKGTEDVVVSGRTVAARRIEIDDPRAPMTLWMDASGEMVVARGPLGMELVPDTKEGALALSGTADIAEASAIRASAPLDDSKPSASFLVRKTPASRFQNGPGQTVVQKGGDVLITVKPLRLEENWGTLLVGQAGGQGAWTKPEMRVPSDLPEIRAKAKAVIGAEKNAMKAAEKVREWVHGVVGVNAGIGVMRDAQEVMESKEGVCRDHAVLMAALLRSVGIPTKLVSGIVYMGEQFYYHAWVEVWNGAKWVPLDSTRAPKSLTVGHVKIASGSVADAFVSFLIEQKVIEVVQ